MTKSAIYLRHVRRLIGHLEHRRLAGFNPAVRSTVYGPPTAPICAPAASRPFTTGGSVDRNLLARYAIPTITTSRPLAENHPARDDDDTFLSASTTPVSASFQATPASDGGRQERSLNSSRDIAHDLAQTTSTIPAMKAVESGQQPQEAKPGSKERSVAGVVIPARPQPPGDEDCCMSGCVNCVYTVYADDLLAYNDSLSDALEALRAASTPYYLWPSDILALEGTSPDATLPGGGELAFGHRRSEGGRSGAAMQDGQSTQEKKVVRKTKEDIQKEIMQNVDPSLRAFLELEAKLKAKKMV